MLNKREDYRKHVLFGTLWPMFYVLIPLILCTAFTIGCASSPFLLVEDVPVDRLPIRCDPPRPPVPHDNKGTNRPTACERRIWEQHHIIQFIISFFSIRPQNRRTPRTYPAFGEIG